MKICISLNTMGGGILAQIALILGAIVNLNATELSTLCTNTGICTISTS